MRNITQKEKEYLLSLKPEEIDYKLFCKLLAYNYNLTTKKVEKGMFECNDTLTLEANEYINKSKIETTVGSFLFNKMVVEKCKIYPLCGFYNEELDANGIYALDDICAEALLNDKITRDQMVDYLDTLEKYSMRVHSALASSFTDKTFKPLPSVLKYKKQLFKENKESLEKGDATRMAQIEKELLGFAKKELEGDSGMMMYNSGSNASFGNNYKNINVVRGAIFNPVTGKNDIVESNFMDGISKEDIPAMANSVVAGAYPKAVGTGVSGYFSKQILAALQAVVVSSDIQDCGSKAYVNVEITKKNKKDFFFRFIKDGGKKVFIDGNNIEKYVGKTVELRTPCFCTSDQLCKTCIGLMADKLEIKNIGLTAAKVSSTLTNLSMKKFHDNTIKLFDVDCSSLFL